MKDTVFASSSAIGGAVAVLRVSGPDTACIVSAILERDITKDPGRLVHCTASFGNEVLDDCMAVFFKAPHSYTGEDMLEIHCHGGVATVKAIMNALAEIGALPAPGGEFTKRAFLNGKMDLSRAEAVMDLVNARAESSRKAALRQLQGGLETRVHIAEELLLDVLSSIDAAIDYPEETEEETTHTVPGQVKEALKMISRWAEEGRKGAVIRNGITVALCGKPNTGKSSLLNCLLGEERAIVTALPGTTRDILNEGTSFSGVPVRLIDTAGIHNTGDTVEQIGVERAREAIKSADILLLLLDGSQLLTEEDRAIIEQTRHCKRFLVRSKSDLPSGGEQFGDISVSTVTGEGIEALKEKILAVAGPGDSDGTITNERHTALLKEAAAALSDALQAPELDCMATDVRSALHALGGISGREADDAVIDRIFERFCVGK